MHFISKKPLNIINGLLLIMLILVAGCADDARKPVKGFVLPEGDVDAGKAVFASVGCRYCHSVTNLELPTFEPGQVLVIELGGQVHKVKDYGELLTSIVNPGHTILHKHKMQLPEDALELESPMPDFNVELSVQNLIDLTAFLHSRYKALQPQYRGYYYVL